MIHNKARMCRVDFFGRSHVSRTGPIERLLISFMFLRRPDRF